MCVPNISTITSKSSIENTPKDNDNSKCMITVFVVNSVSGIMVLSTLKPIFYSSLCDMKGHMS